MLAKRIEDETPALRDVIHKERDKKGRRFLRSDCSFFKQLVSGRKPHHLHLHVMQNFANREAQATHN